MTDTTIQARIDAIDHELIGGGYNHSFVLSPDGADRQRAYEARRTELMGERAALALQQPKPVTGAEWGHMVIGSCLGSVTVRKCEPEVHMSQREQDLCSDDPYLRYAAQIGEDIR